MINEHNQNISITTTLHEAVSQRNIDQILALIQSGADINGRDNKGYTPLDLAAHGDQIEIVNLLIERGADVNARDNSGNVPLHGAILHSCYPDYDDANYDESKYLKHFEIAKLLIDKGADVNVIRGRDGYTPLHIAILFSRIEIIRLLIERGADVNAKTNNGSIPLHSAVQLKNIELTTLLIQAGADIEARDNGGYSPLHNAIRYGLWDQEGNIPVGLADPVHPDFELHQYQYIGLIKLLMQKGAKINAQDNEGNTPLHWAVGYGLTEMVKLLIGNTNINQKNNAGYTPLYLAFLKGHGAIINLLIVKGADNNAKDNNQSSILHWVIKNNKDEFLGPLIAKKETDIHVKDSEGVTPLHLVVMNGNFNIALTLIAKGADIHARDNKGYTPLHLAAGYGRVQMAALLTEDSTHIDDINAIDNVGNTPLIYAFQGIPASAPVSGEEYAGRLLMATFLLGKGAVFTQKALEVFRELENAAQEHPVPDEVLVAFRKQLSNEYRISLMWESWIMHQSIPTNYIQWLPKELTEDLVLITRSIEDKEQIDSKGMSNLVASMSKLFGMENPENNVPAPAIASDNLESNNNAAAP